MATLYAITYPDHATATSAMERVRGLEEAGYLTILERALVRKDERGKVEIDETLHPVRDGVATGGVLGAIAGLIFFMPVAGAAFGATIGGILGKSRSSGARDTFESYAETIERELAPGAGAVVVLASSDARQRVIQNMGAFGGTVHSYDLPDEDLARIQQEVDRFARQKSAD